MRQRPTPLVVSTAALLTFGVALVPSARTAHTPPPNGSDWGTPLDCGLDAPQPTVVDGTFTVAEAKTYRMVPFTVPKGTTRVEVGYSWDDIEPKPANSQDSSTVDLGIWDQHGYRDHDGFRGWSGSRQGKIAKGMDPVWIQADSADRGYRPGPIQPGTWWVELGAGGVAPNGATYHVEIACYSPKKRPEAPAGGKAPKADPVDATHIANTAAGWYYGDFHLHAYHSNSKGLAGPEMAAAAKAKGLDIVPVTEYVTNAHWDQLGATQRAFPELLIWPGREIITYYGHAISLGETPHAIDYRHGFEDVTLGNIQRSAKADGALFSIAHPTAFPGSALENFCRGCNFQLGDSIDWNLVDLIEVHTSDIVNSPFTKTAIELWDEKLREGHKITAVSGADSKSGDKYGATVTAVYAKKLSRSEVTNALIAGHAYVMVRGRADSPSLSMTAAGTDGTTAMFGDTLLTEPASATVTVNGANGQTLEIVQNGKVVDTRTIDSDPYEMSLSLSRDRATEGPLGSYWRIQTLDAGNYTAIGNPIFLADHAPKRASVVTSEASNSSAVSSSSAVKADPGSAKGARSKKMDTSGSAEDNNAWPWFVGCGVIAALAAAVLARRRSKRA